MKKNLFFDYYATTAEALQGFRVIFVFYYMIIIGVPNYSWVSTFPDFLYNPPTFSIGIFFDGFPPKLLLQCLSLLLFLLFVLLFIGYSVRTVSVVMALLIIVGNTFWYGFGKVDHPIFDFLLPLMMAICAWGKADDTEGATYYPVISWIAFILCFAMFTSGFQKITGGWLNPSTQAVQAYLHQYGRFDITEDFVGAFIWEAIDIIIVLFEISFLVVFFFPDLFRWYLLLAAVFHLTIYVFMDISFESQLIVYLLFVRYQFSTQWLKKIHFKVALALLGAATVYWFVVTTLLNPVESIYVGVLKNIFSAIGINYSFLIVPVYGLVIVVLFLNAMNFRIRRNV